jgi:hypothetical protein
MKKNQFLRVRNRQQAQQYCVHDAEESGVGPNSEGNRNDGGEAKPGCFGKLANRITEIIQHGALEQDLSAVRIPSDPSFLYHSHEENWRGVITARTVQMWDSAVEIAQQIHSIPND